MREWLKDLVGASYAAETYQIAGASTEQTEKGAKGVHVNAVIKVRFGRRFFQTDCNEWVLQDPSGTTSLKDVVHVRTRADARALADAHNRGLSVQRKIVGGLLFFAIQIGIDKWLDVSLLT